MTTLRSLLRRPRRAVLHTLVAVGVSLGTVAAGVAAAPAASAAVSFGTVVAFAAGDYSCSSRTVDILPSSNEQLNGNFKVWAWPFVYDYNRGGWISAGRWFNVDGSTTIEFGSITQPYTYAYVYYGTWVTGVWRVGGEWIELKNDLDNGFCAL